MVVDAETGHRLRPWFNSRPGLQFLDTPVVVSASIALQALRDSAAKRIPRAAANLRIRAVFASYCYANLHSHVVRASNAQ